MLLWVLKCNAALLACKHQHAQNNTGRKTLCTLAVLSLTVLKYSSQNHVFTTLILKAGSVLHYFATSHCWGKSPAIPGRKYFCTGTVVLLHKYLILQGTRNFPRIWSKAFLASAATCFSVYWYGLTVYTFKKLFNIFSEMIRISSSRPASVRLRFRHWEVWALYFHREHDLLLNKCLILAFPCCVFIPSYLLIRL